MLLNERRTQILKYIEEQGFVSLQKIVEHFGISESTARRDVEYLDGISKVQKTRGGAAYIGESMTSFEDRTVAALKEKREIAQAVAEMIEAGDVVLLDGGTTTLEVARQLDRAVTDGGYELGSDHQPAVQPAGDRADFDRRVRVSANGSRFGANRSGGT